MKWFTSTSGTAISDQSSKAIQHRIRWQSVQRQRLGVNRVVELMLLLACTLMAGCSGLQRLEEGDAGGIEVATAGEALVVVEAAFTNGADGFSYGDDTFGTSAPAAASGAVSAGKTTVKLGQSPNSGPNSAGWTSTFTGAGVANISFDWAMSQHVEFEDDECSEVRVGVDGVGYGAGSNSYVARSCGGGTSSGRFSFSTPLLGPGTHTLVIGGYLNKNSAADEIVDFSFDNVRIDLVGADVCGDGSCDGAEICSSCAQDCGGCPLGLDLINATFQSSADGFTYNDDAFGTNAPAAASGENATGQLKVSLGLAPGSGPNSGAWSTTFSASGRVHVAFGYLLNQSEPFEPEECVDVRVTLDGVAYGNGSNAYVARACGGSSGSSAFSFTTPPLAAGTHSLVIGAYLNGNTSSDEVVTLGLEHVVVRSGCASAADCDDQNQCTADACTAGSCENDDNGACQCQSAADCDDGNLCTADSCVANVCSFADSGDCLPVGTFLQSGNSVVIEGESFASNTPQGGYSWVSQADASASGGTAYVANPNNGGVINTGYVTTSPRLDYPVNFAVAGTYSVWVRGRDPGPSLGSNDSIHAGLNGAGPTTADRIQGFGSSYGWSKSTMDGPAATLVVPSAGLHTVNLWMREDGFAFDKVLLTLDSNYVPTGQGPVESAQVGQGCGNGLCDISESCFSCAVDCGQCSGPGSTLTYFMQLPAGVSREEIMFGTTGGELRVNDGAELVSAENANQSPGISAVAGGRVSRLGVDSRVGTVWSDGNVVLANDALVLGDVWSSAGITVPDPNQIGGQQHLGAQLGPWQTIAWNVFFPNNPANAVQTEPNTPPLTLAPGSYGALLIKPNSTVILQVGRYTFESIMVNDSGVLELDNGLGAILVYSKTGMTLQGVTTRTSPLPNVLFGVGGTSDVHLDGPFAGTLVAPWAKVNLFTEAAGHTGSVFAKAIEAHQHTTYTHEPFSPDYFCADDAACSGLCPCGPDQGCESDSDCESGLECDSSTKVCACYDTCADKQCGDDPSNGCGGVCPGLCEDTPGCQSNLDCTEGSVCIQGAGPQRGFPQGTSACLRDVCLDMDPTQPDCGLPGVDCGPCGECVPDCEGKTCGPDGCGGNCGEAPDGQFCAVSSWSAIYDEAQDHPDNFPGPLPTVPSTDHQGSLPGKFWVADAGTANYRIPIEVPPGRGGLVPNLGFTYSSASVDGLMGLGWRLDGLSAIARCPKHAGPGMTAMPVKLDKNDDYCLDGIRLVEQEIGEDVPAELVQEGVVAEFRTEIDTFRRVFMLGSLEDPTGFKIYDRGGLIHSYGGVEELPFSNKSIVSTAGVGRLWAISRIEDRAGSDIAYEYRLRLKSEELFGTTGPVTSELLPSAVYYGGHESGVPHDRMVKFSYTQRFDVRTNYVLGDRTSPRYLLTEVRVFVEGESVRNYNLTYHGSGSGRPRSLLHELKLCASFTGCLPATTFEYSSPEVIGATHTEYVEAGSARLDQYPQDPVVTLDIDGDGAREIIGVADDEAWIWGINVYDLASGPTSTHLGFLPSRHVIDINRDGNDDIVFLSFDREFPELYGQLSDGTSFGEEQPVGPPVDTSSDVNVVGDFDGNGLEDLFTGCGANHALGSIYFNEPSGFDVPRVVGPSSDGTQRPWEGPGNYPRNCQLEHVIALDRDGDGDDDLIVFEPGMEPQTVVDPLGDGILESAGFDCSGTGYFCPTEGPTSVLDANGDGLRDMLFDGGYGGVLWLNTGAGFVAHAYPASDSRFAVAYDYDGNGMEDMVYRDGRVVLSEYTLTAGLRFELIEGNFEPLERLFTADLDADGDAELVELHRENGKVAIRHTFGRASRANLLEKIVDGFGKEIALDYRRSVPHGFGAHQRVYVPDYEPRGDTRFRKQPGPLVGLHSEKPPGGQARTTHYRYFDARVALDGRGTMGFAKRQVNELGPNGDIEAPYRRTTLEFNNVDYQLAGLVTRTETLTGEVSGSYHSAYSRKSVAVNEWQLRPAVGSTQEFVWLRGQEVTRSDVTLDQQAQVELRRVLRTPDDFGNEIGSIETHYVAGQLVEQTVTDRTIADGLNFWCLLRRICG